MTIDTDFHLRKIIKENHGEGIRAVAFNPDESNGHMVATAGGDLVSVYDNNHCGEGHLDLSCVFQNGRTEYALGGEVTCLAWLAIDPLPHDWSSQAFLAFGSKSGEIGIVNMAETRVQTLLKAHASSVDSICPIYSKPGYFLSCSAGDKAVRIWNAEHLVSEFSFSATSIAIKENKVVLGNASGKVECFGLDGMVLQQTSLWCWRGTSRIDCMDFIDDRHLAVHEISGKIHVLNVETGETVVSFAVPRGDSDKTAECQFGISHCRDYLTCGNSAGEAFIFEIISGKRIGKLSMPRIKGAVKAAKFAPQSKSVLIATDDSFLWRWDNIVFH